MSLVGTKESRKSINIAEDVPEKVFDDVKEKFEIFSEVPFVVNGWICPPKNDKEKNGNSVLIVKSQRNNRQVTLLYTI